MTASAPEVELSGLVCTYLKRPKFGLPTAAHPLRVGGQAHDVLEGDRLARIAQRLRHRLPHRDHQRGAHDRRVVRGHVGLVGAQVQQPAPERAGGRPHVGLQAPAGDGVLGVAGVHRLHRDEDALAGHLRGGRVELRHHRLEQLLLLGRDDEGQLLAAGRGGARPARGRRCSGFALPPPPDAMTAATATAAMAATMVRIELVFTGSAQHVRAPRRARRQLRLKPRRTGGRSRRKAGRGRSRGRPPPRRRG